MLKWYFWANFGYFKRAKTPFVRHCHSGYKDPKLVGEKPKFLLRLD